MQSSGCYAAASPLSSALDDPAMVKRYYDENETLPIPTKAWSIGDDPRAGRVHLDIYVTGCYHGGYPGKDLDGSVTMDD